MSSRADSLRAPAWVWGPAVLAVLVSAGPLAALAGRIPWTRVPELLGAPGALDSLRLSVLAALAATVLCALLGLPLALLLTRLREGPFASLAAFAVYAPLVLSPVVSGLALVFFWGRRGVIGALLSAHGLSVAFTPWAVVLAQVFVALPFFVATAATALRAVPRELEELAATEGAGPWERLVRVALPIAAPGLWTAALLSFARAVGEYGATITFAGNVQDVTRTVPLRIDLALASDDMDAALGGCLMLLGVYAAVAALFALLAASRRSRGEGLRGAE